jgi:hypothetical protein
MAGARGYFMAKGIHWVAISLATHIDYGTDADRKTYHSEQQRHNQQ